MISQENTSKNYFLMQIVHVEMYTIMMLVYFNSRITLKITVNLGPYVKLGEIFIDLYISRRVSPTFI